MTKKVVFGLPNLGFKADLPRMFSNREEYDAATKTDEPYNLAGGILVALAVACVFASGMLGLLETAIPSIVVGCVGAALFVVSLICFAVASYKRHIEITENREDYEKKSWDLVHAEQNMNQQYLKNISKMPYPNNIMPQYLPNNVVPLQMNNTNLNTQQQMNTMNNVPAPNTNMPQYMPNNVAQQQMNNTNINTTQQMNTMNNVSVPHTINSNIQQNLNSANPLQSDVVNGNGVK